LEDTLGVSLSLSDCRIEQKHPGIVEKMIHYDQR